MDLQGKKPTVDVLCVEDSPDLALVWQALFRKAPLNVKVCGDAGSALNCISYEGPPCVLVTDYFLPDRTGVDIINEARKVHPQLPCILVTGNEDVAMLDDLHDRTNVVYLKKPVKFSRLREAVEAFGCIEERVAPA